MKTITLFILLISTILFSQEKTNEAVYLQTSPVIYNMPNISYKTKEWSARKALFRSKEFLFKQVLGVTKDPIKFNITPLASTKSDELTTLIYKCEELNKNGLILGFYGHYWNENGVSYNGYGFKNLEKEDAIKFLNKIEKAIEDNKKFLQSDHDNNNIYFEFDDMQILIYKEVGYSIRLFWNGFDSSWDNTSFNKTKSRFEFNVDK